MPTASTSRFSAIRQFDVERAPFLAKGKIARAVQRKREDVAVSAEDRRRAISLVHVRIDNRTAPHAALCLHRPDRNRHIVEHAESLTVIREGVMRSAGEVDCDACVECGG